MPSRATAPRAKQLAQSLAHGDASGLMDTPIRSLGLSNGRIVSWSSVRKWAPASL